MAENETTGTIPNRSTPFTNGAASGSVNLDAFSLVISGLVQSVQELPPQAGSNTGLTIVNIGGLNIMARHALRNLPYPGDRATFPCFTTVGAKGIQFWMIDTSAPRR